MAIFRTKPFVAGAIFWTYQDYRTPTNFVMGVVNAERTKRGSWEVLRQEYSPVLIDSVIPDAREAAITLRARGPADLDLPAYTLRGYTLRWIVRAASGSTLAQGDVSLPSLAPGSTWSGRIEWKDAGAGSVLSLTVLRPTGFTVIEQSYPLHGNPF